MSHFPEELRQALFANSAVRYAAVGEGQQIETIARDELADSSDASSDFFEELFVNPALLTLARQRGELDCGGLTHLVVGYGNFSQVVMPFRSGHLSVCVEKAADMGRCVDELLALAARHES